MGLDLGIERTGVFEVLACVEKVHAFADTIRFNRDNGMCATKEMGVYETDISDLDPADILSELGLQPGEIDVVVGGPPCQSFSTGGRRRTIQDPRGSLLWEFLRFVEGIHPRFFLMENVRGLMSAAINHRPIRDRPENGGPPLEATEQPGSVMRAFIRDLHDDYRVDCFLVNAVNYGAPQLRERALFFGTTEPKTIEFPDPTHGNSEESPRDLFGECISEPLIPFATLGDAIEGFEEENPLILDFSPRKKGYLAMVPPGGNWRCLPEEVAKESMGKAFFAKGGRSGWWRRLSFGLPCPTIVTMPNHASTSLCHPVETRALSLRECARIQGFPDEWEFCGTTAKQYAQVGNAVPVRLGEVCSEVLQKSLLSSENGKHSSRSSSPPIYRVEYVKAHIRTRKWFKNGEVFTWDDGGKNRKVRYSPARTRRTVLEIAD